MVGRARIGSGRKTSRRAAPTPGPARLLAGLAAAAALGVPAACGGSGGHDTPRATLVAGSFELSARNTAAGEHQAVVVEAQLPGDLPPTRAAMLVLTLRDGRRPSIDCPPLRANAACATLDWAEAAEGRPARLFENSLTVGSRTLYLRETGAISSIFDRSAAAGSRTGIGGAGRRFAIELLDSLEPGAPITLRLVMTGPPDEPASITYELGLERQPRKIL